jgi:predicted nucleic acid-binding protein
MTEGPAVIDTNVLVAGLLTAVPSSPTARILDGMLTGQFRFLLSDELLFEYRDVLLRPNIARRHQLSQAEVDVLLTEIAANGIVLEPKRPPRVRNGVPLLPRRPKGSRRATMALVNKLRDEE